MRGARGPLPRHGVVLRAAVLPQPGACRGPAAGGICRPDEGDQQLRSHIRPQPGRLRAAMRGRRGQAALPGHALADSRPAPGEGAGHGSPRRDRAADLGARPDSVRACLARYLAVSAANLREARLAELALRPYSLDEPLSGQPGAASLADRLGGEDPRIDHMLSMPGLATHCGGLPPRPPQILLLRFRGGMTQAQIGPQPRISPMPLCRPLAPALGYLRLLGYADCAGRGPLRSLRITGRTP